MRKLLMVAGAAAVLAAPLAAQAQECFPRVWLALNSPAVYTPTLDPAGSAGGEWHAGLSRAMHVDSVEYLAILPLDFGSGATQGTLLRTRSGDTLWVAGVLDTTPNCRGSGAVLELEPPPRAMTGEERDRADARRFQILRALDRLTREGLL